MHPPTVEELILVYDADTGFRHALADSLKKLFGTSGCSLCDITHGVFGVRKNWVSCARDLGVAVTAYHRDQLPPNLERLTEGRRPCVVLRSGTEHVIVADGKQISRLDGTVEALIAVVRSETEALGWNLSTPRENPTT